MLAESTQRWLLAVALLLSACRPPPAATPPRLAFFGLEVKFRADPKLLRRFEELVPRLVEELGGFRMIPAQQITPRLQGRRGQRHPCLEAQCQVRVGREVSASVALGLRAEKNLVEECDVFASLYELRRSGGDQRSRARAGCAGLELKDSIQRAVCRVLTSSKDPAEQEARHRDCLAAAELVWLEQELDLFRLEPPASSPEALVQEERRLAEKALALRARYQALQRAAPTPAWSVAAECRSGRVYEAFADSLTRSGSAVTVPRSVRSRGEAAALGFRTQMTRSAEEHARPLRKQAAEIYRACSKRAVELKVDGRYPDEARRRLAALEGR